jgi:hypothetical protein
MYQRDTRDNLSQGTETEVKKETETETETEIDNGQADTEVIPVAVSESLRQQIVNLFDQKCIECGRKNVQTINVGGVKKKYTYRPIRSGERNKLAEIEERRALAVKNIIEFLQRKKKGEDVEKFSDVDNELNEKMAEYFLVDEKGKGMTAEDYALTEFEEINPILQGYSLRTEKPLPLPFGGKAKPSK